ncbi:hypothetical protein [Mesorhizobium sp. M0701]|uniref:hypothetical protein n=1 Tax=Mesorhizobium sp. M0701 TaxID=2956989 RepID=UPI003336155C
MLDRKLWHADVTETAVMEACGRRLTTLDNPGFCLACGLEVDGVEPDACGYECEACGEDQVYGCEELMMEVAL